MFLFCLYSGLQNLSFCSAVTAPPLADLRSSRAASSVSFIFFTWDSLWFHCITYFSSHFGIILVHLIFLQHSLVSTLIDSIPLFFFRIERRTGIKADTRVESGELGDAFWGVAEMTASRRWGAATSNISNGLRCLGDVVHLEKNVDDVWNCTCTCS